MLRISEAGGITGGLHERFELEFLDYQRAVLGAKTDAIAKCDFHLSLPGVIRHVIQIACRIGFFQIDRWRNHSRLHRAQSCSQTSSTARALRMTNLRFRCGHRYPMSATVK